MRPMSSPIGRTVGYATSILATRRTREFLPYVYPVVVVIELSFTLADITEDK